MQCGQESLPGFGIRVAEDDNEVPVWTQHTAGFTEGARQGQLVEVSIVFDSTVVHTADDNLIVLILEPRRNYGSDIFRKEIGLNGQQGSPEPYVVEV
ncbi:hypothetical protein BSL84_27595 [Streptomyces sp. TN58]|nr:hypothetical protein BSL84_27595 [Streptomyces sp. TN58]